jgi:1-acyl-sn-glycerol-3-phosphate acyltransferase
MAFEIQIPDRFDKRDPKPMSFFPFFIVVEWNRAWQPRLSMPPNIITEGKNMHLSLLRQTSTTSSRDGKTGHPFVRRFLTPLIRRFWIGEVYGLENIPEKGACLVALNHESYFDFLCFTAAIDRKIHYLAAEKFFDHPIWKRVMNAMECIRVDRFCRVNRTALKRIIDVIAEGRLVGIFPEGTRSPDGRLMRGKPGIAYLAQHTGIPVIPVGLIGTFEILSRNDRIPRLRKAVIKIGEPIRFGHPEKGKTTPEQMQAITDQIMLKIAELTGENYPCRESAHE